MAEDEKKVGAPKDAAKGAVASTDGPSVAKDGQSGPGAQPLEPKIESKTEDERPEPKSAEIKSIDAHDAEISPHPKPASDSKSGGRPAGRGSEWTASDDRGPLGRAWDDEEATAPGQAAPAAAMPAEVADAKAATTDHVPPVDAASAAERDDQKDAPATSGSSSPAASSSPVAPAAASAPSAGEPKRSLWPVAAALVLGAVIGAGSAAFIYRGNADDTQPDPKVASLSARVDALEKRPDAQSAVASLKTSVTALDGQVAALRQSGAKSNAPAASQGSDARADVEGLTRKIAALQADLDALKSGGSDTKILQQKVAALEGALAETKSATDKAQASVSSVESRQKQIAGKVAAPALAVVADSLIQQIDHGQPYATQVDALATLGADPAKIAVLRQNAEKGVPSAGTLAARFEPLALPITATANKAPPNAGVVDRLKSGMFSLVSIRRADDTSGTDLPSRVARIKAALAHDDVAGALDAWNALPADAKAKADAWAALAKTHADAMNAARALQHESIAALGAKKS